MNFDKRITEWVYYAKSASLDDPDVYPYVAQLDDAGTDAECFQVSAREINEARDLMREMLAEIKRLGGAS